MCGRGAADDPILDSLGIERDSAAPGKGNAGNALEIGGETDFLKARAS